nr:MAG TPA: hypothetical protein [Caudoviricetes sp.]
MKNFVRCKVVTCVIDRIIFFSSGLLRLSVVLLCTAKEVRIWHR